MTTRLDAITLVVTALLVVVIGLIWAIAIGALGYILASFIMKKMKEKSK